MSNRIEDVLNQLFGHSEPYETVSSTEVTEQVRAGEWAKPAQTEDGASALVVFRKTDNGLRLSTIQLEPDELLPTNTPEEQGEVLTNNWAASFPGAAELPKAFALKGIFRDANLLAVAGTDPHKCIPVMVDGEPTGAMWHDGMLVLITENEGYRGFTPEELAQISFGAAPHPVLPTLGNVPTIQFTRTPDMQGVEVLINRMEDTSDEQD